MQTTCGEPLRLFQISSTSFLNGDRIGDNPGDH